MAGCGANVNGMRRRMVEVGYYGEFEWDELPKEVQAAFVTLGYTADIYDDPFGIGLKASSDGYAWADLKPEQQEAAILVGYDELLWDEPPTGSNDDVYNALDDNSLITIQTRAGGQGQRQSCGSLDLSVSSLLDSSTSFERSTTFIC